MRRAGFNLPSLIKGLNTLDGVRRADLHAGDHVIVNTRNSVYTLRVLDQTTYCVSGGWFDRKGLSPFQTTISGCTWGGCILRGDVVAVGGMCLEFGNHVVTSTIRHIWIFRHGVLN